MYLLITLVVAVGAAVVIASPFVMHYVANRPANGEKKELKYLDDQIDRAHTRLVRHCAALHNK